MAQKGELPGKKVANQWRFHLSSIDEYLQDKIIKTPEYDLSAIIKTSTVFPLSRLIHKSDIMLDLRSGGQSGVLRELSECAEKAGLTNSKEKLYIKLFEREQMLTTAIGNGVAIPHPRNPSEDLIKKPGIIIGRSNKGVDFGSPDKKKIHLFVMPCASDVILHLKLLSKIAHLFKVENINNLFLNAKTKDEVIKILLGVENIQINTGNKY